jgi:uncharacterized membrane protein
VDGLEVTVTSAADGNTTAKVVDKTIVSLVVGVDLWPDDAQNSDPGQTLIYNHTLENTGNYTDTFTFSYSSSEGWTVNLPSLVELGPGESTTAQVGVVVPAGTISGTVDQTAVVVKSGTDNIYTATVTDTTTVNRLIAVDFTPDRAQNADPGVAAVYNHTLTNTGNLTDTFTFSYVSNQGWTVNLPSPVELGPGESTAVQVTVVVPASALFGVVDQTTVTAASAALTSVKDDVIDTTTVNRTVGGGLTAGYEQNGYPGDTVTYIHTLENTGNYTDTFTFGYNSSEAWMVYVPAPVTLAPNTTSSVQFMVEIPAGALADVVDTTTISVTSGADSGVYTEVPDETTVNQVAAFTLSPAAPQDAEPGDTLVYSHTVINTGNGVDTFILDVDSSPGWVVSVSENPTLNPGESQMIQVTVTVPSDAADGTVDTTTLTVESDYDSSVADSTEDVTTVVVGEWFIYLPILIRP